MVKVGAIPRNLFYPALCFLLVLGYMLLNFAWAAKAQQNNQSSPQAVYSKEQADTGSKLYSQHCASCHGAKLQGVAGPPLGGAAFEAKWLNGKKTADDLYYIMHTQMPLNAPGSLKESEYLDILAFVLQQNGYPAGKNALSTKELKDIKLTKPQKAGK